MYSLKAFGSSQVRTKQPMEEQILSEVTSDSDKTAAGAPPFVRSSPRFRQKSCWKNSICLKSPWIQTKPQPEPLILSEVALGSDKTLPEDHICLKSPQVQTKPQRELLILSEVAPGSDKTAAGAPHYVRSSPRFRQNRSRSSSFCPKSPQVQTKPQPELLILSEVSPRFRQNRSRSSSFCPKSPQVQTKPQPELLILSEVAPGSDKTAAGAPHFVRSSPRFRQNRSRSSSFCPKSPQVQTKPQPELLILSEVAPGSDKTAAGAPHYVRSSPGSDKTEARAPHYV